MPMSPLSLTSVTLISPTGVTMPLAKSTREIRPPRSVTHIAPSGPHSRSQGVSNPAAIVLTRCAEAVDAHQRKNLPVGGANDEHNVRPFQISLRLVGTVHIRERKFTCQNRLNAARARGDVKQLDLDTVFLEQSFLLGHEHTALRAGD